SLLPGIARKEPGINGGFDMNRRDRFMAVALAGAALAAGSRPDAAQEADATPERIKRTALLPAARIAGAEPYHQQHRLTGGWPGGCIDMANDIAAKLSAKVEYVESTWGNQIRDLQGGKVDLAFAVNPTPERALVIDLSTPMLVHSFTVIAKKGFTKPQNWSEI